MPDDEAQREPRRDAEPRPDKTDPGDPEQREGDRGDTKRG